jgi:hypothetical protein
MMSPAQRAAALGVELRVGFPLSHRVFHSVIALNRMSAAKSLPETAEVDASVSPTNALL